MTEALRIKAPDLEAFIARAFEAVDVPPADAKIIAKLMTRADVNGSEGHRHLPAAAIHPPHRRRRSQRAAEHPDRAK